MQGFEGTDLSVNGVFFFSFLLPLLLNSNKTFRTLLAVKYILGSFKDDCEYSYRIQEEVEKHVKLHRKQITFQEYDAIRYFHERL